MKNVLIFLKIKKKKNTNMKLNMSSLLYNVHIHVLGALSDFDGVFFGTKSINRDNSEQIRIQVYK